MSRKSRPPKAKGRKGRKSKKVVVNERAVVASSGPPFGLVVLIALVMSIPSLMQFVDGSMAFDSTVLRFLAALAVSWLLVNLVYTVAHSFRQEPTIETTPLNQPGFVEDPHARYRVGNPPGDEGTR